MKYICFAICAFIILILLPIALLSSKPRRGMLLEVRLGREPNEDELYLVKEYRRGLLLISIALLAAALPMLFISRGSLAYLMLCLWLFVFIFLLFRHVKVWREKLLELSGLDNEEERQWLWGIFYNNPKDKRAVVSQRDAMGTTVNVASAGGKVFIAIIALSLLAMPASAAVILVEDYTPIELRLEDAELVSEHVETQYAISFDDISEFKLISDYGEAKRTNGTGLDNVLKGDVHSSIYGNCIFCVNPKNAAFLMVEAGGSVYVLSGNTDEETVEVFEELKALGQ